MRHAVADLRGAELGFEGLDDGGAVVTITKGESVNIRFAIPPAAVHGLRLTLEAFERRGCGGTVTVNDDGSVTYRDDGSVIDGSKTGGVGFSL